uniref:Leucine-rich repeat-containing protein n=1 Tax=Schistosoma haematobium TaxID=6185 RepID=A0A095A0K8_SCHHA
MNTGSKSVCSAPVEEQSGNNERTNSMIPKCVSKKSVKFPGECNLVTCVIDPVDPWLNSCQLNGGHIDMLEYVFKYVQFQYVNLENTNLDDEVPYMEWLDLRENNLGLTFVQILSSSLRIPRKDFKPKEFKKESFDKNCNRLSEKLSDKDTFKTSKNVSITESNLSSSKTLPFHSRGLHFGSTGINGQLLHILIPGIRLGCITDLRLPDNGITGSDAKFLVPLLRYSSHLKYLDLSRNLLGVGYHVEVS